MVGGEGRILEVGPETKLLVWGIRIVGKGPRVKEQSAKGRGKKPAMRSELAPSLSLVPWGKL